MTETTTLNSDVEATVQELLKLPVEQRIAIGERLIDSAAINDELSDIDREWIQVAAQRARDLREGRVKAVSIDEAFERARRAVDAVRSNGSKSD